MEKKNDFSLNVDLKKKNLLHKVLSDLRPQAIIRC